MQYNKKFMQYKNELQTPLPSAVLNCCGVSAFLTQQLSRGQESCLKNNTPRAAIDLGLRGSARLHLFYHHYGRNPAINLALSHCYSRTFFLCAADKEITIATGSVERVPRSPRISQVMLCPLCILYSWHRLFKCVKPKIYQRSQRTTLLLLQRNARRKCMANTHRLRAPRGLLFFSSDTLYTLYHHSLSTGDCFECTTINKGKSFIFFFVSSFSKIHLNN